MSRSVSKTGSIELRLHLLMLLIAFSGASTVVGMMEAFDILEAGMANPSLAFWNGLQTTALIWATGAVPLLWLFYLVRKRMQETTRS